MVWGSLLSVGAQLLPGIISGIGKILGDKGGATMKSLGTVGSAIGTVGNALGKAGIIPQKYVQYSDHISKIGEMMNSTSRIEEEPYENPNIDTGESGREFVVRG